MILQGKVSWKTELKDDRVETLYKVEDLLRKIGITFDTGHDLVRKERDWFIDKKVSDIRLSLDIGWQGLIFRADEVTDIFSEMMQIQAEVEPGMMELVINTAIQNIIAKRDLEILSDES